MGSGAHVRAKRLLLAVMVGGLLAGLSPTRGQTLADALDATNLVWITGGDVVWFAETTNTQDGFDAARSGIVGSNQTSWIETSVVGPATLKYWFKTSAFPYAPYLGFELNDGGAGLPPTQPLINWGNWSEAIHDLGAGTNVLRWSAYNPYESPGQGFVLLDEVSIEPPRPLTIVYQPQDSTAYSGASAYMSVTAQGTPPFRYQWFKDGLSLPETNSWITLDIVTTNDSGAYSVVVSNAQGYVVSSNAVLTVLPPSVPFFVKQPANVTAYTGQSINLFAYVDGSPPFYFQWRKDGIDLPGQGTGTFAWGWDMFSIPSLAPTDAGNYTLFVTNAYGSVESSNAAITVLPSIPPTITHDPRSLEAAVGINTWLSLTATGAPDPILTWTKVGTPPSAPPPFPGPPIIVQPRGIEPPPQSLSLTNVTTNTAGIYFATVTNVAGAVTSREVLVIVLPPIASLGSWWQGAEDLFVTNAHAFLAQGSGGLGILDVANPASPFMVGGYNTPGFASAVCVADGWAYVADGSAGLQILSVTNPFSPVLVASYNTPNYATRVTVRSNLAYVVTGGSLQIINVANKAAPVLAGSFSTNLYTGRIALAGNLAFLCGYDGMAIVDVSNPTQPFELGRSVAATGAINVRDHLVFASGPSGLSVIDISNPAQPATIGSLNGISIYDLQVVGSLVYLVGYSSSNYRLFVVDVRDPTLPIPVGDYTVTNLGNRLFVEGNRVYLEGSGSQLAILDTPFSHGPELPPTLSLCAAAGIQLGIHGRRGLHYEVESSAAPVGLPWQPFQPVFLTNDTATLPITPSLTNTFFRLKQLD